MVFGKGNMHNQKLLGIYNQVLFGTTIEKEKY